MLRQIEWWVQIGSVTKSGVLLLAAFFFFWNFCFSLRPSYKSLFDVPTTQLPIFDGAFFLWVSVTPRKFARSIDIPIRVLKEKADIFADYDYVCWFFNESIKKYPFLFILKSANITPIFKNGYRGSKEEFSKIFEKFLCKQIAIFITHNRSKTSVGLEKVLVLNNTYLRCLKNGKPVDKNKTFGILLTDLSKAFDCLPYELIIATKLNAYGLILSLLKLMYSYLSHRKQRTNVNHANSSWEKIFFFFAFYKALSLKANNKLWALSRATPHMFHEKNKFLINSFFNT